MAGPKHGMRVTGVAIITLCVLSGQAAARDAADFIVPAAESALRERRFGLAVSLWRGVVAIRGDADPAVEKLARAWTLAGEFDAAVEELERRKRAVTEPAEQERLTREIIDLEHRVKGFTGRVFEVVPAVAQAREAFRRGRSAYAAKQYAQAEALFRAGVEMAPDLPGNYRELGESLEQLGRTDDAIRFLGRYLRMRPYGKNADEVRTRLTAAGAIGWLSVGSSFACEQVWMNRQVVPQRLPLVELAVAPGRYRLLCFNETYHFARYISVDVPTRGNVHADFSWAIIENKLDPWGRIVMENPDRQSEMNDIGVWNEIGVPVPEDQRPLKVLLRAGDASRQKELFLKLEAGRRIALTW